MVTVTGRGGGFDQVAEVEDDASEALIQFDRNLLDDTLTRDLVQLVWDMNRDNFAQLASINSTLRYGTTFDAFGFGGEIHPLLAGLAGKLRASARGVDQGDGRPARLPQHLLPDFLRLGLLTVHAQGLAIDVRAERSIGRRPVVP